jgi:hypothetical protein
MNMNEPLPAFDDLPDMLASLERITIVPSEILRGMKKQKMGEGESLHPGHTGTTVWYTDSDGYILEMRFTDRPDLCVKSPCTFTPTFGLDAVDGQVAQDVEEYVLFKLLGRPCPRLKLN